MNRRFFNSRTKLSSASGSLGIAVNSVLPAITGTTTVGSTLTCSDGTWSYMGAGTAGVFTYQWYADGVLLVGETAATHDLVSGDLGTEITCVVTATNAIYSASIAADGVGPITGGGGYAAKAVHFDPTTTTLAAAFPGFLDSLNSYYTGLLSVWIKSAFSINQYIELFNNNPDNYGVFELNYNSSGLGARVNLLTNTSFELLSWQTDETGVVANAWQNYIFSWDSHHASGLKRLQIAVNGVLKTVTVGADTTDKPIYWTQDTAPYKTALGPFSDVFDVADFYFDVNKNIDLSDSGNLSKFISGGKPVDPAVAVAAFGNPVALFSGDATGFATNQGTGGTFTLTGSLTNASTSPSD